VLEPSWLYTAVTRAEKQVVLVGDLDVLEEVLARPFAAATRYVGFEWLGGVQ
jgi:exodeoxyribonuclease V alpha subunit